jgi:hypothetical protein
VTLILGNLSGWLRAVDQSLTAFRLICCLENYIFFIVIPVREILPKHLLRVHKVTSVTDMKTTDVAGCRGRYRLAV